MNEQPATTRPQTVVAMNYDGSGDLSRLVAFIADRDALLATETVSVQHFRDADRFIETHRVTFDALRLRNTEAHAASCAAGFVTHVE